MKRKKFVPIQDDSHTLVELISMEASDPYYWISNVPFEGPCLYVIEFADNKGVGENLETMFPEVDFSDKEEREEAFQEYADLLVESGQYIPIPERLC